MANATETDTTYNGWTNRATWLVNLHLTNDYDLYRRAQGTVASAIVGARQDYAPGGMMADYRFPDTDMRKVETRRVAEALHDLCRDLLYEALGLRAGAGYIFASDLALQALSDVDWYDVADGFVDDFRETE